MRLYLCLHENVMAKENILLHWFYCFMDRQFVQSKLFHQTARGRR